MYPVGFILPSSCRYLSTLAFLSLKLGIVQTAGITQRAAALRPTSPFGSILCTTLFAPVRRWTLLRDISIVDHCKEAASCTYCAWAAFLSNPVL